MSTRAAPTTARASPWTCEAELTALPVPTLPRAPRAEPPVPPAACAPARDRIGSVDALRGIAAASVAWFHLTHMDFRFLPDGALKSSGSYGWLGVEIFFVISGFVIPWSLHRARYTPRGFARFVTRRVVRLDPPYLVSMLLVLALAAAAPLLPAGSTRTPITPDAVALHLGYANAFVGDVWLNPVYWTLAIELQWYLLVGAIHPLIAGGTRSRRMLTLAVLCAAALLPSLPISPFKSLIFPYLGFFVMGMAAFQLRAGIVTWRGFVLAVAMGSAAAAYRIGLVATAGGIVTVCLIAGVDGRWRALAWLGEISYSLYLVHSPVGMPFLRYAIVHDLGPAGRMAMLALAAGATLGAAWLMWRFVERPAQRWARRIGYAAVTMPVGRAAPAPTGGARGAGGPSRPGTPFPAVPRASVPRTRAYRTASPLPPAHRRR